MPESEASAPRGPGEGARRHWDEVYSSKAPDEVSWYQAEPTLSLEMIERAGLPADAPILDVGGGTARLVAGLLDAGYRDLTVADLSSAALERARAELGPRAAARVQWLQLDIRTERLERRYALWHDRAVFHFMVDEAERGGYLENLREGLRPGGHLVLATFGPEGPTTCSGLPVRRYGAEGLQRALGWGFRLVSSQIENHTTPAGTVQQFLFAHFLRESV
jgi:SAM-dependent methyltransferase